MFLRNLSEISNNSFLPLTEKLISIDDIPSLESFDCGNRSLNEFLKKEAYLAHVCRDASTTLFFQNDELVAYYTLSKDKIKIADDEAGGVKEFDCLYVARIAVSEAHKGSGIGSKIVKDIVQLAFKTNERFIALDALYYVWKWYRKRGFTPMIESETQPLTHGELVYMIMDLYRGDLLEEYAE